MKTETLTAVAERPDKPNPDKNDITLEVFAPRFPDPKTFTWLKTIKTGDAAREAANAFGYQDGNPTLEKNKVVLDNKKPLVANNVRNGDKLELVDESNRV